MEKDDLEQILELEKKLYLKLVETMTLTTELSQAVQRQDQQAVQMLIASRQMPVLELQEIDSYIKLKRVDLNTQDAACFDRLMAGEQAQEQQENAVVEQIALNQRLLHRLTALDQTVNRQLCGKRSRYGAGTLSSDSYSAGAG